MSKRQRMMVNEVVMHCEDSDDDLDDNMDDFDISTNAIFVQNDLWQF